MKILICDDEYTNLEILKKYITEYTAAHCIKADIYATASSKDVFESSTSYDLAFLDIQMPDIDGISVAKELKNRNQKVVIFFVTAFDEYQDEAMDLHAFRFFDVLSKAFLILFTKIPPFCLKYHFFILVSSKKTKNKSKLLNCKNSYNFGKYK